MSLRNNEEQFHDEGDPTSGDLDEVLPLQINNPSEFHRRRRRQGWAAILIGLVSVSVIVAIISVLLSKTSEFGLHQSHPVDQATIWKNLIQSKIPSTTFGDPSSPQQQALDWMSQDEYSMTLASNNENRILQRFALAVLYYSTNHGPYSWNKHHILTSSSECEWDIHHIKCANRKEDDDDEEDVVIEYIELKRSGLTGTIPQEIGLLSSLTMLNLGSNKLEGTLPTEIGYLSNLGLLHLFDNINLKGRIPTEIGNLSKLTKLDFDLTHLSGTIPSNLCDRLTLAEIECANIECDCCVAWDGKKYVKCAA